MSGTTSSGTGSGSDTNASPFNPRIMFALIVAGALCFVAYWALTAFAPNLASGNNGGGHALSKGATGFAGIADLTERAGSEVHISRGGDDDLAPEDLLVLTPTSQSDPGQVEKLITAHDGAVLVILPKWDTVRDEKRSGWVGAAGTGAFNVAVLPEAVFGKISNSDVQAAQANATATGNVGGRRLRVDLPRPFAHLSGEQLQPLLIDASAGGILLRSELRGNAYVLTDPDLLSNLALADKDKARQALTLLDAIAEDSDSDIVTFDVTLNGFGGNQSLIRYAFTPPFIAITICLIAAGIFAGWQAWNRFGPPALPQRALPLSKEALIANAAELLRQGGRELDGADAYVAHAREALASGLHAPPGKTGAALDTWLDRFTPRGAERWSVLAQNMQLARNRGEMLAYARAISDFRKDVLRDH